MLQQKAGIIASSDWPSWSGLALPNVLTLCHLGLILVILLCLCVAILAPTQGPRVSHDGPSSSSLEAAVVLNLCRLGVILTILLCL